MSRLKPYYWERRQVEGRVSIPKARLIERSDGTLDISNERDLGPTESNAEWWESVLFDFRATSPKIAANESARLSDLNSYRELVISCRPCEMVRRFAAQSLLNEFGADKLIKHLDTVLDYCPQGHIGRQCHARWRRER